MPRLTLSLGLCSDGEGTWRPPETGIAYAPRPTAAGVGHVRIDATGVAISPIPTAAGEGKRGANASGENEGVIPTALGEGGLGISGFGVVVGILPTAEGTGTLDLSAVGNASTSIPIAAGTVSKERHSAGVVTTPAVSAAATAERESITSGAATLPMITASGESGTTSPGIVATGGTLTNDQTYQYHTFTANGTFEVTEGEGPIDVLLVAGGGAGGGFRGGGGGGGGVILQSGIQVSVGTYPLTVGAGGAGNSSDALGQSGGNSTGFGLTAIGGGGGGGAGSTQIEDGANGGSGGGGAGQHSGNGPGLPGSGTPNQGTGGGIGNASTSNPEKNGGGGGGGAGAGGNGTVSVAGDGGAGFQTDFNGSTARYGAGGGGGSSHSPGGAGGTGGGGAGASTGGNGSNGSGIGSGGGGGGSSGTTSGNGTAGAVIIRYPFDPGTPPPPGEDPAVVLLQCNSQAEFNAGEPGGQGHQQTPSHAQCLDFPEVMAIGIDVGSMTISTDKGATWGIPRRIGLNSTNCQGIAVDPKNPLHWLAYPISDPQASSASSSHGGLYYSGDGCDTFTRVYNFDNSVDDGNHLQCEAICFHPASFNGTRCMRAYAYLRGNTQNHFVASTDGGQSFSLIASFSQATHGHPRTMAADPSNINTVYVTAGNSLYRVTNANSSGSINFSRRSGTGNLPGGNIYGQPYVSSNGQTLYVGVRNIGVFRSTNGADSWTQLYSDANLHKLWVNPYNTQRQIITYHGNDSGVSFSIPSRYSTNGGTAFNQASSYEKRPGYSGNTNTQFEHTHIYWFDSGPEVYMCGRHTFIDQANSNFRSSDSGNTWSLSMAGASWEGVNAWQAPQFASPSNPLRFALPYIDVGVSWTNVGGQYCTIRRAHQELPDMDHGTAVAVALHPNGTRVLAMVGRSAKGILVRIEMPSGNAFKIIDSGLRKYHGLCYDANDPDFWFAHQYRSTDGGQSFSTLGTLGANDVFWGCTLNAPGMSNGQAIFTVDEPASAQTVKRTTNRGNSFTTVLSASYNLINGIGTKQSPFRPHPGDPEILFTQTPGQDGIRRWDLSSGSASNRPFDDYIPNIPGGVPWRVLTLAIDARFPDNMVIANQYSNTGHTLYHTPDGGETWDNLSHLVPGGKVGFLEINQRNGDIILGTTNGTRMLKSPTYDDPDSNVGRIIWPNNVLPIGYMAAFLGS